MIHIACNIDHRYVQHCAVMLASVVKNSPNEEIAIHIVGRDLTEDDHFKLEQSTQSGNIHLYYYMPDAHLLDGFTIRATHKRLTQTAYYRCFFSTLLPKGIHRVIYLDCDLLVLENIRELWDTDLKGMGVGVIEDTGYNEEERYTRLQYPHTDSYFNSGVMVIDLDYWREHDIAQMCAQYYQSHYDSIVYNDQDILNGIFHNQKVLLDIKWNVQDGFYRNKSHLPEDWYKAHTDALLHPAILHFTNRKPWEYDSQHPLRSYYFQYLDLTPWKGQRPLHNPLNIIKRFVRLLPFKLGIRHARYININSIK